MWTSHLFVFMKLMGVYDSHIEPNFNLFLVQKKKKYSISESEETAVTEKVLNEN